MGADAMNLSEMGTGERVKKGADLKIHRMSRSATMTECGQRAHRLRLFSGDGGQRLLNLRIAFLDASLIELIEFQCLLESTHMFRLIIANPGGLNGVFTRLQRSSRILASTCGFRSLPTMARIIRIPVAPVMSLTTGCSCRFINVNAFCIG